MEYSLRRPLSLLASGFLLLQCTPDFDSLTAGHPVGGDSGASGNANVGGSAAGGIEIGGTQTGGTQTGGTQTGGTQTGGAVSVGPGGEGGVVGHEPGGAGGQFHGGEGGEGGEGAGEPCSFAPLGATFYDTFDTGLDGPGFANAIATASTTTTKGATCSSAWDPTVGSSCLGAFHIRASYQAYASGGDKDEVAYGDLLFDSVDWSSAIALHVMVKVAPLNAPIEGVQLFVMSGDDYRYISVFDAGAYKNGKWNEMTLYLVPGAAFDETKVHHIGAEIFLRRADAPGIPEQPPTVDIWFDDIWVENG